MAKPSKNQPASAPAATSAGKSGDHHPSHKPVHMLLGVICFIAGAAVMVIEISAYRLLAPLFGNSVYTWTALIGVILISFSVGGFLGGWLSDRKLALDLLGWLLAGAAVLTFFIPALHELFGLSLSDSGLIAGPVVISVLLFAVPGILLGAVSPASVRFYSLVDKDSHVGAAAGTISMLGSLGSFVGTFLSGFVLLSSFGVKAIFMGTATVLLLLSAVAFFMARNTWRQQLPIWMGALIAAYFGATATEAQHPSVVWRHDSFYHRLEVTEHGEGSNRIRELHLDRTKEGGMRISDGALVLDYQRFWKLAMLRDDTSIKRALFIGAGAFGMPEEVSRTFPEAAVDVVEIDPQVIEVGEKFFKLSEHPKVQAHASDARRFLRVTDQKWDFIFGDAYNGERQIPSHLASKEFFQLVADRLAPGGVFLMNIIAAPEGPKSELLGGMLSTLHAVFPHVEAFAVQHGGQNVQNVILLASQEDWEPLITGRGYVPGSWQQQIVASYLPAQRRPQPGVVFTDDFNPVDAIIRRGLWE